jgi:hypothetical protein
MVLMNMLSRCRIASTGRGECGAPFMKYYTEAISEMARNRNTPALYGE